MFTFKLFQYVFDPLELNFIPLKIQLDTTNEQIILECSQGLDEDEYRHQRLIYGICDLDIQVKSFIRLLAEEFTDPFYLFQVFSITLWMVNQYKLYASIIIITTLISLFVGAWETRKNLLNIQTMARYSCPVNILRKEANSNQAEFIQKASTELVPGDIFELQDEGMAMPCDCLLIQGTVIINEAMLTGESTPIIKSQIPQIKDHFKYDEDKKYFLFAGTRIIQKRSRENKKLLGLVTETGFNTIKGNLIRSILYPKKMDEKFEKDSYKYIGMMSILCLIGFAVSIPFLRKTQEWGEIIKKSLDLITTAVPPSLPACLGIGISYSIARLKKQKIMCIARDRVNVAGKVNILCFDKTGTLTEDHLDIYGYRSVKMKKNSQDFQFNPFIKDAYENSSEAYNYYKQRKGREKQHKDKNKDLNLFFVECLATCHCATYVNDKIIGDPVDVKMFESSGWTLHENSAQQEEKTSHNMISTFVRPGQEEDLQTKIQRIKEQNLGPNEVDEIDRVMEDHYELGIVRRFDFVPKLQRMSVITKNVNENFYKVFCKGSPEKLRDLCLPETIPETFNDTLNKYAIKGFRVLAMAFKTIKMSYIQSQQITRDKAENKMIFLGLLIVQNKLKPETRPTLNLLESAGLKMVMATGDNILTAISVSKECELIKKNSLVYSCEIEGNQLVWNAVENFDEENDPGEFIIEARKEGDPNNLIITDSTGKNTNLFEKGNEINTNSNNIINDFDYNKKGDGNKGSGSMNIYKNQDNDNNENKGVFGDIINTNVENRPSLNQKRISIASGLDYDGSSFIDNFPPDRYSILYSKRPSVMVNVPILPTGEKEINPNIPQDDSNLMGLEIKEYPFQNIQEDYVIAMTGKTFETLCAFRERFLTTNNENFRIYNDVFKLILLHGRVFARMAPEHKALLVEGFKKEQLAVLMCGDGANDCMALRTANIGVSLSEEEASIAAPFTSKNQNISCLVPLLKEGKSSLVTSIQTFKYMMMYSLVQFLCVTMLMVLNSYLSENQFLSVDIFIIIPLAFFIPATGPYKSLTKHHPTDSLISYPVIASILSQTIIAFVFQLAAHYILVFMLEDYDNICQPDDDDTDILACPDNTSVFLISNMQYLITAFAFSISKPFKSPIYTNYYLTFFMIFAFVYSCFIIVYPNKISVDLLQLYNFDDPENSYKDERRDDIEDEELYIYKDTQIKYYIQGLALLNFIISYIFEKVIIPATTAIWNARKIRQLREIKRIQSEQALTMQQLFQISE
jgi:cation-transporting ATPase 13A3/4/5